MPTWAPVPTSHTSVFVLLMPSLNQARASLSYTAKHLSETISAQEVSEPPSLVFRLCAPLTAPREQDPQCMPVGVCRGLRGATADGDAEADPGQGVRGEGGGALDFPLERLLPRLLRALQARHLWRGVVRPASLGSRGTSPARLGHRSIPHPATHAQPSILPPPLR